MTRAGTARHAARRDKNESEVIDALRENGCLVESLSQKGIPDLLVWSPHRHCLLLLEVKDGSAPPSKQRLREAQVAFHALWKDAPVYVVSSVAEALEAVGSTAASPKNVDEIGQNGS